MALWTVEIVKLCEIRGPHEGKDVDVTLGCTLVYFQVLTDVSEQHTTLIFTDKNASTKTEN